MHFSVPFVLYTVNLKEVSFSSACLASSESAEPCSLVGGLHVEACVCGNANCSLVLDFTWKSSASTAPVPSGWETGFCSPLPVGAGITASSHGPDLEKHLKTIVIFPTHISFNQISGTSEACAGKDQHPLYFPISVLKKWFCCKVLSTLRLGPCHGMGTKC